MRLLNSKSLEMSEFYYTDIPPYAILSHTWGKEEITLQDMQRSDVQKKTGFSKIRSCCEQAKLDGIEWVWIDTCCIDKTSSAELSEAINSMYAWYEGSEVCYAFLEDVNALDPFFHEAEFKRARWFRRGWCLQELIAPRKIEFYAANWTEIGTKWSLHGQIEKITGIPAAFLLNKSRSVDYTMAQKMSWASRRRTTREEDEAYCLLGIFGISMPLLYGEGRRAFHRLQEEIMKRTEDYSILLSINPFWNPFGVLASSPASFPKEGPYDSSKKRYNYGHIKSIFLDRDASKNMPREFTQLNPLQMTTRGLRIHTFVRNIQATTSLLLWTGCMYGHAYMCIMLQQDAKSGLLKYGRSAHPNNGIELIDATDFKSFELSELYLNTDMWHDSGPLYTYLHTDLEMILSTKCQESIFFVEAYPSLANLLTGSCTQGRRLYCPRTDSSKLSLNFIVCQHGSGITTGHFTVNLSFDGELKEFYASCSLVVGSDTNLMSPSHIGIQTNIYGNDDNRIHGSEEKQKSDSPSPSDPGVHVETCEDADTKIYDPKKGDESRISDRATGQLPNGRVVYVAIKATRESGPFGYLQDRRQRKPANCTLYVTLL